MVDSMDGAMEIEEQLGGGKVKEHSAVTREGKLGGGQVKENSAVESEGKLGGGRVHKAEDFNAPLSTPPVNAIIHRRIILAA